MPGLRAMWNDVWLLDGVRTAFAEYATVLSLVSPTDLGIKAARAVFERSGVPPTDAGVVVAGNVAQASFDAYMLPRHIGLYSGVPVEVPAQLVQRVCGTGIEAIIQASDVVAQGRAEVGLCVGAESMSRNPVAAYTHRNGFRMGQVEFKDFLWESLLDTAAACTMGGTAENLAKRSNITRAEVDQFAACSFARAEAAQHNGFLAGEITPVVNEDFEIPLAGYQRRGIRLPREVREFATDTHVRPSPLEALAKLKPAFGGVQTGGNSSGIVDGAAAALVASGDYVRGQGKTPLGRIVAATTVGVAPEFMGIGPVPAIQSVLEQAGIALDAVDRFEINEAFGAQCLACVRELGLDQDKVNVNGGAIAIGHPLAATGVRLSVTVARELKKSGKRYGIASACIGGGQGIALLIENPEAA